MNPNFMIALEIMAKGMISIFIVLGLISLIVTIMGKILK